MGVSFDRRSSEYTFNFTGSRAEIWEVLAERGVDPGDEIVMSAVFNRLTVQGSWLAGWLAGCLAGGFP